MPYTDDGKAVMLYALRELVRFASLHSARPTDGFNELPHDVYRRQPVDLRDPVEGEMRTHRELEFEVPPGAEVRYVGFWTRATSGVMLAYKRLPTPLTYRGRGVLVIDAATLDLNLEEG